MCLNNLYTLIPGQAVQSFPNFYLSLEFKQNSRGLNRNISLKLCRNDKAPRLSWVCLLF